MSLNIKTDQIVRALLFAALAAAAIAAVGACADTDPLEPADEIVATLTVSAVDAWSFVAFVGQVAEPVNPGDRATSEAWDLGFFATSVMLNGGAAGPAGVVGHCLCQNASATNGAIMAMTPDSKLVDFEAVTAADIPTETSSWTSDALAAAIDGWYSYDPVTHVVSAAPENVWKVRTASGESFAKFHVTGLEGATQSHAGRVTFEFAVQPVGGGAFEPPETVTVDVSSGAVRFDIETGAVAAGSADWDLQFDGYDIRVNGGVSGTGSSGASLSGESFGAIVDAGDLTATHYRGDAFGGVFDEHPWYRYNLDGNHQIWPTFDVYLVRRGDSVYKVQITSYYGATGDARQITFRYAKLQ